MQENESIQIKPRRKRRSPEQIAELVREFGTTGLGPWQFCEDRGIAACVQTLVDDPRRSANTPNRRPILYRDVFNARRDTPGLSRQIRGNPRKSA